MVGGFGVVHLHLGVLASDAIGDDLVDLGFDVVRRGVTLLLGRRHLQAVDDDEVQNFIVVDSSRIFICHMMLRNF